MDREQSAAVLELDTPVDEYSESALMDRSASELQELPVAGRKKNYLYLFVKRVFDLTCSIIALILLSPVFLVVAVLIKREDGGPVIHRRVCVGKNGQYNMLKFRTMVADAEDLEKYLTSEQIIEYKKRVKLDDDPRLTRVGQVLRKFSIDELPQLINVLRNEMSIVGPRPVTEDETLFYLPRDLSELLQVKPGITGYWQTSGRSDCTYETGERQVLEMHYVRNCSIWLDIKILIKTIGVVLSRKGAK